jgi:3-hydroxyisobutyrate dehydrogenase-like beta-hydroxyacid dehydrogenase
MHDIRAGFIGLGDMGGPMAQRIIDAGFPTTLWARGQASLDPYDPTRFTRASTPAELGARSNVVGICVFNDDDVRAVLLGENGVLAGMAPGGVVLIHATVTVAVCEEVAAAATGKGVAVLDAPVSGARAASEAGTLTVMVGGDPVAMARALPVIQAYARVIRLMGRLGSGQKMKALNNVTGYCNGRIASIAVETGRALGLDADAILEILRSGGAASFALESIITRLLPDPDFRAHAATMIEKDTRLFQGYCRDAALPRSVMEVLAEERIAQIVPELAR